MLTKKNNDMIEKKQERTFCKCGKALFDEELLVNLRTCFMDIYNKRILETETDREKKAVIRGETTDSIRLDTRWYHLWLNPSERLLESIRPFTWAIYPPQLRFIQQENHEVRWHQDYGFVNAMGNDKAHKQIITCFIPWDDDPYNRVTVQFAKGIFNSLIEHKPSSNGFAASLDCDFEDVYYYDMDLGDCAIFGDYVPHRTFAPEDTLWNRKSFEFRLIKPNDAKDNKDYFDIEKGSFVMRNGESSLKIENV